jgi:hypothetical protein
MLHQQHGVCMILIYRAPATSLFSWAQSIEALRPVFAPQIPMPESACRDPIYRVLVLTVALPYLVVCG